MANGRLAGTLLATFCTTTSSVPSAGSMTGNCIRSRATYGMLPALNSTGPSARRQEEPDANVLCIENVSVILCPSFSFITMCGSSVQQRWQMIFIVPFVLVYWFDVMADVCVIPRHLDKVVLVIVGDLQFHLDWSSR